MNYLIVSDLHLGKGRFLRNGQLNILEDFFEDESFYEFCEYYSSGKYFLSNVNLVLNGDILNLIQIDVEGVFPHIVDEEFTIHAVKSIVKGHQRFFDGLKKFLDTPNKKITYIIGNHDAAMAFEGAQEYIRSIVGDKIEFGFSLVENGVHVEHGHRFEAINTVPLKKYFSVGPNGKKILNLPWGSLFCISVLPRLKKERPFIDKVRPMSSYIIWTMFHDIGFFLKMARMVISYIIQTNSDTYLKQNQNFKTNIKILKQITIYPRYEAKAKRILKKNRTLHTVIMGHTHLKEWRRFPEGKYYFNTGTWNAIPSIDAAMHESQTHMTFCLLEVHAKSSTLIGGTLSVWQGKWKPFKEEISTN